MLTLTLNLHCSSNKQVSALLFEAFLDGSDEYISFQFDGFMNDVIFSYTLRRWSLSGYNFLQNNFVPLRQGASYVSAICLSVCS